MAFGRVKFEDYDSERKGSFGRVLRALPVALAVLLGVVLLSFVLTGAGLFPGNVINRFVVSSYLKDNYPDSDIVSYDGYDRDSKNFVYSCEVNGSPCKMEAGNFRVRYDGYYNDYCRNGYFEGVVEKYTDGFLNGKWHERFPETDASWSSVIDIPLSAVSYPSAGQADQTDQAQGGAHEPGGNAELIQSALDEYGGSLRFTLNIRGDSVSFDDYKGLVYGAVNILQTEMANRPQELLVYYYRDEDILQYTSRVSTFQFNYNESGIRNATDLHSYAEIPEELETKVSIYYIVKAVFLIFLSVTVIALIVLWCVRRFRKHRKRLE